MKKNTLLIILGVVTVICVVAGSVIHIGGGIKSLRKSGILAINKDDPDVNFSYHWDSDGEGNSEQKFSFDQTLEAFSSIKMDVNIMEIRIENGDQFRIQSSYSKDSLKPSFSINNGVLEISQFKKRNSNTFANYNCKVIITIPSGTNLDSIQINSNIGEIKARDFTTKNFNINLNVGEISVRKVNFDQININNNVGEVTVNPVDDIDSYTIFAGTDIGEVNIGRKSHKRSYNQEGNSRKRIKINTNVGEINIR